jgi:hypothetical protein
MLRRRSRERSDRLSGQLRRSQAAEYEGQSACVEAIPRGRSVHTQVDGTFGRLS